ncbi:MAG: LysR family transcriptional regulator [Lacunisphaera sp.]
MYDNLFSERGLSLDRLRVLVEVYDAGGIAKAAPGDPIRQSQYSRQLRELSEFFGTEVAHRQGRQLKLTPQGVQLAELVRSQLHALQDFRAECRSESVDYTIAAGDSLIHWLVIPRLGEIMRKQSSVRFATSNLRTNEIVQQLKDGRVDFGVIRKDAVVAPLKSAPLGSLSFVAVVPKALLPSRGNISLGDVLGKIPFAAHTSDGQFTQKLRDVAKMLQTELRPALICQSFPQAMAAVRSGGFGSVLPALALKELEPGSYREIPAETLRNLDRSIVLVWNSRLPKIRPSAKKLIEYLQNELRF